MSVIRNWIAGCLLAALAAPAALSAQDVKYTETTRIEAIISLRGPGEPSRSTTWVSKGRVRTDNEDQSTIMDFTGGTFTQLDHKAKSYYTITFADMMANAQQMMTEAKAEAAQAQRQEAQRENPQQDVKIDFDVKVDRLGDGGRVAGYGTEHVVMVLTAKVASTQPDPQTGEEVSGKIVFVNDMWVAKDFPGYKALQEAQLAAAKDVNEEMRQQAAEMAEAGKDLAAVMPGLQGGGLERMAEEMKKIEGTPVRSLTYQLMLPDTVELDRDAVLALADKPLPSVSLGAAMGQAAKQSARDALRGGLGGLLGRKKEEPKPAEAQAPGQPILMRITSTIEDVSTGAIPDDVFKPTAGYKEVKPDWMSSSGK